MIGLRIVQRSRAILALLLILAATGAPRAGAASAQASYLVPNGSYVKTCQSCQFFDSPTTFHCLCDSTNIPTTIDLNTCVRQSDGWYWLSNNHGKLQCATQGQ